MIQLQPGQFAPCTVSWDENRQIFRKNTPDEIYLCCNKSCKNYQEKCRENCQNDQCRENCEIMSDVCDKYCQTARYEWNNRYFDNCLEKNGCLKDWSLDNQCLVEKKEEILNCCEQNCPILPDLSCSQHCNLSYDINLQRSMPYILPQSFSNPFLYSPSKDPKYNVFPIYLLVVVAIIFYFLLIKWRSIKI